MKKLVDIIDYGNESISIQDDSFVMEATTVIGNLRGLIKHYKLGASQVYKHEGVLKKIKTLEKLMSDRFGLNYQLIYGGPDMMAYFKIAPEKTNGLDEAYEEIMKMVESSGKKGAEVDPKEIRNLDKTAWRAVSDMQKEYIRYTKENTITFDRKNAKVINSSKKVIHYIAMDWVGNLFADSSDKEYLAVLLHEIGHSITFIEYSSKAAKETINLIEAFKSIKDPKGFEKLITVNAKKYDVKEVSESGKTIETLSKMFDSNENNVNYYKDAEALADQFATRFGLGSELVNALTKFHRNAQMRMDLFNAFLNTRMYIVITINFIFGGLTPVIIALIPFFIIKIIFSVLIAVLVGSDLSRKTPYDNLTNRLQRILEDIYRQLRIIEKDDVFNKEERIAEYLNQIEVIKINIQYANTLDKPTSAMLDHMINGENVNYSIMERSLEALEANPMNALKHRLGNKIKGIK